MKLYPKNIQGIKNILSLINKLADHNLAFYKGTIHYFEKEHLPWPESLIYYHPEKNMFLFLSRTSTILSFPKTDWDHYSTSNPMWIRENNFSYLSVYPFIAVVSEANWILYNTGPSDKADAFHQYMQKECVIERELWKVKLVDNNSEMKPLF